MDSWSKYQPNLGWGKLTLHEFCLGFLPTKGGVFSRCIEFNILWHKGPNSQGDSRWYHFNQVLHIKIRKHDCIKQWHKVILMSWKQKSWLWEMLCWWVCRNQCSSGKHFKVWVVYTYIYISCMDGSIQQSSHHRLSPEILVQQHLRKHQHLINIQHHTKWPKGCVFVDKHKYLYIYIHGYIRMIYVKIHYAYMIPCPGVPLPRMVWYPPLLWTSRWVVVVVLTQPKDHGQTIQAIFVQLNITKSVKGWPLAKWVLITRKLNIFTTSTLSESHGTNPHHKQTTTRPRPNHQTSWRQ